MNEAEFKKQLIEKIAQQQSDRGCKPPEELGEVTEVRYLTKGEAFKRTKAIIATLNPTPRTDAAACKYSRWIAEETRPDRELVDADFARQLERELAQAKADLAAARKDSERLRNAMEGALSIIDLWFPSAGEFKENETEASALIAMHDRFRAAMEGGER